jgi:hypothetical protein
MCIYQPNWGGDVSLRGPEEYIPGWRQVDSAVLEPGPMAIYARPEYERTAVNLAAKTFVRYVTDDSITPEPTPEVNTFREAAPSGSGGAARAAYGQLEI